MSNALFPVGYNGQSAERAAAASFMFWGFSQLSRNFREKTERADQRSVSAQARGSAGGKISGLESDHQIAILVQSDCHRHGKNLHKPGKQIFFLLGGRFICIGIGEQTQKVAIGLWEPSLDQLVPVLSRRVYHCTLLMLALLSCCLICLESHWLVC